MGLIPQVNNMQQNHAQGYNNQQKQNHQQNMIYNSSQTYQGYGGNGVNNNQVFNDSNYHNSMYNSPSPMNVPQQYSLPQTRVSPVKFQSITNQTGQPHVNSLKLNNNQFGNNRLDHVNSTNMNQYGVNANNHNNCNTNMNQHANYNNIYYNEHGMNTNNQGPTNNYQTNHAMVNGNQLLLNNNTYGSNTFNNGQPMNYNNQLPMNTSNNMMNPNNYYNMANKGNGQMMNQQQASIQIDPFRMNQRTISTPQTPNDNYSDGGLSPCSFTSFDSTSNTGETEAVRIVFPLNVDFNDVLFRVKLAVPELVGNIYNEEKIKPVLTTNEKKQLIYINTKTIGIAKLVKDKCSFIKLNNELLEITVKDNSNTSNNNIPTNIANNTKDTNNIRYNNTKNNPSNTNKASEIYSVEVTGIKAIAFDKFFSNDLRKELSQLSGNNSFEIKEKTIIFNIQPTPNIQNVLHYLQNLVLMLLKPACFTQFYCENTQEMKYQTQMKLPSGVYLYIEESKAKFTTYHLTSLSDIQNNQAIIDLFKTTCSVPKDAFSATRMELKSNHIQFKYIKQNEKVQFECILRSDSDYTLFRKIKNTKNQVHMDSTQLKFMRKYSPHLLKTDQTELEFTDNVGKVVVFALSKESRQSIEADLKRIKTVKIEFPIPSILRNNIRNKVEKYFNSLTNIQIVSSVFTIEELKNIQIFFCIFENYKNEDKIRNELTELYVKALKGSSENVQAKQLDLRKVFQDERKKNLY